MASKLKLGHPINTEAVLFIALHLGPAGTNSTTCSDLTSGVPVCVSPDPSAVSYIIAAQQSSTASTLGISLSLVCHAESHVCMPCSAPSTPCAE